MDLGEAIKMLRIEQGLTQRQMAERCGISVSTVSDWETGKTWPPRGASERVCEALGIPTSYLILASIEEEDLPEEKRVLYRALLEPLRNELIDKSKP